MLMNSDYKGHCFLLFALLNCICLHFMFCLFICILCSMLLCVPGFTEKVLQDFQTQDSPWIQ